MGLVVRPTGGAAVCVPVGGLVAIWASSFRSSKIRAMMTTTSEQCTSVWAMSAVATCEDDCHNSFGILRHSPNPGTPRHGPLVPKSLSSLACWIQAFLKFATLKQLVRKVKVIQQGILLCWCSRVCRQRLGKRTVTAASSENGISSSTCNNTRAACNMIRFIIISTSAML